MEKTETKNWKGPKSNKETEGGITVCRSEITIYSMRTRTDGNLALLLCFAVRIYISSFIKSQPCVPS